ncbi:MAG: hypothetical protein LBJ12_09660 [Oscillospiraceae bacterium]|nr:hypothetical protein [Oscillospiraceae bacterium]
MSIPEFLAAVKDALQQYVVDGGYIAPQYNWLKELFAIIYDWFAGLFA